MEEKNEPNELYPLKINIKQEKTTTHDQDSSKSETIDKLSINLNFPNFPVDVKSEKCVEPLKSSNEILTELFKVFNSAPPEIVDDSDSNEQSSKKKKKKHKKKSKKKHKDNGSSSSDTDSEKKSKKKKKSKSKHKDKNVNKIVIKKEKLDSAEKAKVKQEKHDSGKSKDKDKSNDKDKGKDKLKDKAKDKEKENEKEKDTGKSNKIKIKSLKDSEIFKEVLKKEKERDKKREKSSEKDRHKDRKSKDRDYDKDRDKKDDRGKNNKDREKRKRKSDDLDFSLSEDESFATGYDRSREDYYNNRRYNSFYERDFYGSSYRDDKSEYKRRRKDEPYRDSYRHRPHSQTRSRSRSPRIDKKKLLEIARKNAITMLKNGTLPGAANLGQDVKEKLISKMKHGGKSIEELTDYCKKLSNGEMNELSSVSSDDSDHDGEGSSKAFNHPFLIKDRGPIVMNIKNSVPLPPKTAEQTKALLMQFPVSSGQQHRTTENEWVPVQPTPPTSSSVPSSSTSKSKEKEKLLEKVATTESRPTFQGAEKSEKSDKSEVFPKTAETSKLDVSSIITQRLNAMRKLQDNPTDSEAVKLLYNTQKDMTAWASSKFTPGQFLGSTGANVLSAKELASGYQPWARKDMMIATQPVSGGMGMHLLQKMGWIPGEGLGKEKNGSLQPLLLEVKLDKKGLVASEEEAQRQLQQMKPKGKVRMNLDGKHPVSLLGEYASKRKWKSPQYHQVHESGPGHCKNFIFKVIMNGLEYQPAIASNTKKEAKATAAKFCLQQIGVLPS